MRYYVTVRGRTLEVDLGGELPLVDGRPVEVHLDRIPDSPVRHLLVDGRSHVLIATREDGHMWALQLDGEPLSVEAVDERTRTIRAMTGAGAATRGPRPVKAPMPGLVVRVDVKEGDRVRAGQSVAIIEAMKMENELKTEAEGVVARVPVSAGQAVEKGSVLVEFEAESPGG